MNVVFDDDQLDRLETDASFTMGKAQGIVRAYRKCLQLIRSAPDERDFYEVKSLRYEKLKGKRQHQRSMRLNNQFRLVLEVEVHDHNKQVRIVGIEDYH
jgi:proteic killer suppression protein